MDQDQQAFYCQLAPSPPHFRSPRSFPLVLSMYQASNTLNTPIWIIPTLYQLIWTAFTGTYFNFCVLSLFPLPLAVYIFRACIVHLRLIKYILYYSYLKLVLRENTYKVKKAANTSPSSPLLIFAFLDFSSDFSDILELNIIQNNCIDYLHPPPPLFLQDYRCFWWFYWICYVLSVFLSQFDALLPHNISVHIYSCLRVF